MIGGPITPLFPEDRLTEEPKLISQVAMGKIVDHFITRRLRKDGMSIDVSVTLSPVCNNRGQIVAVSKIARDITASRQRHIPHDSMVPVTPESSVRQPAYQSIRARVGGTGLSTGTNRTFNEQIDRYVLNSKPSCGYRK